MELKSQEGNHALGCIVSSNRTFMELKWFITH